MARPNRTTAHCLFEMIGGEGSAMTAMTQIWNSTKIDNRADCNFLMKIDVA